MFPPTALAIADPRYPTGDSSATGTWSVSPTSPTTKWDKVDEASPDDDSTYITCGTAASTAYFGFSAFSVPAGSTIQDLIVYYRSRDISKGVNVIRAAITVGGTAYPTTDGGNNPNGTTYGSYSYAFTTNPKTGAAWTVADINGSGSNPLQNFGVNCSDGNPQIITTQVYAEVNYTTETNPPTPNPMTFSTSPANDSSSQISMVASTATDDYSSPVNYLFTNNNSSCGSNAGTGGTSSSWQASTSYSDSGLQPNQCYGYTVTARDSLSNTGTASSIGSSYTSANVPGTPTLGSATATTLNLTNAENSNPAANPTTSYAVQIVTTTPTDNNWLNKWIDASGNPSASAVWLTDAQLDALVLQGLASSTTYGVKVKAKNEDGDETALSAEGQGTTSASVVISVILITDGTVAYGYVPSGSSRSTITSDLNDTQTVKNDGNVAETFQIKGQNTTNWTLAGTAGSEQYVHQFCTATCSSPPTNFTSLTTSNQTLGSNIAANGTLSFDLSLTVPTATAYYSSQSVDVTITAIQY